MRCLNANKFYSHRRVRFFCLRMAAIVLLAGSLTACFVSETDRKMLENGFVQYSSRHFDAAQSAADQFLQKNPTAPNVDEAYYLRGLARMAKPAASDKAAAAQDLHMAIEKSNRNDVKAKAHRALGDIAFDTQQWQQAVTEYEASLALALADKDAWLQYRLGASLQCLGQWEKSRPFFQRVISINSEPLLTQRSIARMSISNFSLQFGAFTEQARANDLVRQLKTPGGTTPPIVAAIVTEMRDGQLLFLIRSGSYPTWRDAEIGRARLQTVYPKVSVFP